MAFFSQSRRTPPPPAPDESTLHLPLRAVALEAFGGPGEVRYLAPSGDTQAGRFEAGVRAMVDTLESRFYSAREGSVVSSLAAAAGRDWVAVDPETDQFLTLCGSIPFMTQGAVDPSCGALQALWDGWGERGEAFPTEDALRAARDRCGWALVQRTAGRVRLAKAGMSLACDELACAYAADAVARLAEAEGIGSVHAQIGGASRSLGAPPGLSGWRRLVGIARDRTGGVWSSGHGIAQSGSWERVATHDGRGYLLAVDPRSGRALAHGGRVGIAVASSALQAAVLSQAALVLGLPRGTDFIQSFPGCEGALYGETTRGQTRGFALIAGET